ncbi:MAG: glycosyltransferase [Oxalobacter sp.]|nr:MAG: glycosyltransferase [Oxalobacter sp.]
MLEVRLTIGEFINKASLSAPGAEKNTSHSATMYFAEVLAKNFALPGDSVMSFSISVIISTFDCPKRLDLVLLGFEHQTVKDFQIIVADYGATEETLQALTEFKQHTSKSVLHVSHSEEGFHKPSVLNQAILQADGEYLIFTDGMSIPRKDFVEAHMKMARTGRFLSGGRSRLPPCCAVEISRDDVSSGSAFNLFWLLTKGYPDTADKSRLLSKGLWARFLNFINFRKNKWYCHNSSGWKTDILSVNGFDERMQSMEGMDWEMGYRLKNSGIKVKSVRYTAACIQLFYDALYYKHGAKENNDAIREETTKTKKRYTRFGILKS